MSTEASSAQIKLRVLKQENNASQTRGEPSPEPRGGSDCASAAFEAEKTYQKNRQQKLDQRSVVQRKIACGMSDAARDDRAVIRKVNGKNDQQSLHRATGRALRQPFSRRFFCMCANDAGEQNHWKRNRSSDYDREPARAHELRHIHYSAEKYTRGNRDNGERRSGFAGDPKSVHPRFSLYSQLFFCVKNISRFCLRSGRRRKISGLCLRCGATGAR